MKKFAVVCLVLLFAAGCATMDRFGTSVTINFTHREVQATISVQQVR